MVSKIDIIFITQVANFVYEILDQVTLQNPQFSPKNRPRRPKGGVKVQLYSFFNIGARCGGC